MPDPADTAAGETKTATTTGNWSGAPGSTGTSTSNNGSTSSGSSTSNNGATGGTTSAPGKTDSEAKSPSTSSGSTSNKTTSTSQSISSPSSSGSTTPANGAAAAPATTTAATTTPATSNAPSAASAPKVMDPSRGTMAGNPATGATYTAGSPTPTYDANDGIMSMAEAEARYNAAQSLNNAFGVGPSAPAAPAAPAAPSAPAAPDGAFGPRANPAADYMSSIMGGPLGPVGPTSGLMGTPPGKAITDRVAPDLTRIATSFVTQPGLPAATRGITAPAAPPAAPVNPGFLSLPPDVPRAAPAMPAPVAPPAAPPMTPRNAPLPPGNSSSMAMNNLGATGEIADLAQVVADPSMSPPQQAPSQYAGYGSPFSPDAQLQNYAGLVQSGALNPVTGQPQPASGYPPSEYAGYGAPFNSEVQIGQWENVDPPADGTAPSQVAGQPQTAGELANRAQYTYDQARDGFKGMPGRIYDAIVGGNITAGQDLAALQDQRGGGGGILPQDEPVDVASLEQLMAQLKRRGVSGNQQLKLILSTFV